MERKCYLCEETEFTTRQKHVRDRNDISVIECSSCGLVTLSTIDHLNPDHYEKSGMHGGEPQSMDLWLNETSSDDLRRFNMLKPLLINKKILDFGCGNGGFLTHAAPLSSYAAGVELEERVIAYYQWQSGFQVFGGIEDADCQSDKFDIITAFHVLEHVQDPRSVLSTLSKHLRPDGTMVVEVPSASDALLTLYGCEAFERFTYWSQHLFLFTAATLARVAEQSGLTVRSIKQFQRYPLSNHLYWLARGKPGGHSAWSFVDTPALNEAYAATLGSLGKCDTLIAYLGNE